MKAKIKMMIVVLLASGCAQQMAGKDSKELVPVSYQTNDARRLRRIAIAPIRYEFTNGGERQTETENSTQRTLLAATRKILSDEKGYEAIPLQIYEDIIPQKFHMPEEQFKEHLDVLTDWAGNSGEGEQPPEKVTTAASKLGRPLNVDGLLVLRGSMSLPSPTKCVGTSLLATGPLFPLGTLYFCRMESRLRADIYEVSTGKIVWRRECRTGNMSMRGE